MLEANERLPIHNAGAHAGELKAGCWSCHSRDGATNKPLGEVDIRLQCGIEGGIMRESRTSRRAVMSALMNQLVGLWLVMMLVAWVIYEVRDDWK